MASSSKAVPPVPSTQGGVALSPSGPELAALKLSKFDSGIAFALHTWQALTVAVQNHWGGGDSSDKRDWFAGAISDLFTNPETAGDCDVEYLEEFMGNVMFDEFEVNIDDDSTFETAEVICRLKKQCDEGNFSGVEALEKRWGERKGRDALAGKIITKEEYQEVEEDEDDYESEGEDDDAMEVDGAPPREKKEKPPPEVDEDGFTTVRRR